MLSKDHKNLSNYWINPSPKLETTTENHGIKRDLGKNSNIDSSLDVNIISNLVDGFYPFVSKRKIRSEFLKKRKSLSGEIVEHKSNKIKETLLTIQPILNARSAGLYYPVNNEVDITALFDDLVSLDIEIYFPRISDYGLIFCKTDHLNQLIPDRFGVPAPEMNNTTIKTSELDVILVPGVVFDREGNRIGYGSGYYDRALEGVNRSATIGLCYEFQLVPSLPAEKHDRPVGAIVTEMGYIKCEKERR